MKNSTKENSKKVSAASVAADAMLAAVKLSVGSFTGSHALISDGVHSCADIFSSLVVLVGTILSRREKPSRISPKKAELVSLLILSALLCTTGLCIGISGFCAIFEASSADIAVPPVHALCVSAFALAVKELMFVLTIRTAKREKNDILFANAWHHQSDALSCFSSFLGILIARLGFPKFDPIASIFICAFIVKTGIDVFLRAMKRLPPKEKAGTAETECVQNRQK
ncbi:MAG: cation diffusion facilitator family transporter [Acutalibacteraceae bacterium]